MWTIERLCRCFSACLSLCAVLPVWMQRHIPMSRSPPLHASPALCARAVLGGIVQKRRGVSVAWGNADGSEADYHVAQMRSRDGKRWRSLGAGGHVSWRDLPGCLRGSVGRRNSSVASVCEGYQHVQCTAAPPPIESLQYLMRRSCASSALSRARSRPPTSSALGERSAVSCAGTALYSWGRRVTSSCPAVALSISVKRAKHGNV